ncbi:MAG TPA: exodeoxyribonuclease VII small subunit [Bacteroidales bacterium]|nr:MAG: exodeoxyribonuclease VII small subunit [Bacteroidetes bacterium GWE2_42_24]OFY27763.1 MAG: exodeoxyribonuclease VII small subunit [Bacteroidetes bacterium GWF2_43_11]PKP23569.1 MAG: exodeoxyribonuclease VII small subunit [Bacteroidetes bacterium HGW-Bacteroidetes-22]HAQ64913.1 exodeoxyribonuclease VII small subunit [Bacteroidales bacterium]HBZ66121.1 exodeoxyribonuclease VII small subunit [Bacteroidales bacterium]
MEKEQTYSEAYAELEQIVGDIENATVEIEELSLKVKRAAWLLKFCREKLLRTEADVNDALGKVTDPKEG